MLESTDVARRTGVRPGRGDAGRTRRGPAFHSVAIEVAGGARDERRAGRAARDQRGVDRLADRDPERPVAGPDERLSDYAARGGRGGARARRRRAGPSSIWCSSRRSPPDEVTPNAAPLVAHALGAASGRGVRRRRGVHRVPVGGRDRRRADRERAGRWVLVVGADFITRIVDWDDRKTAPLFGDAAGAAVLGPANGEHGVIGPIVLGADGSNGAGDLDPQPRPQAADGRAGGLQARGRADGGGDARGARPRRADARRHRPVRLPPGQRADHARARRAAGLSSPSASSTASSSSATRRRRRCRWRSRTPSATAG